jgi:hypothetical protein
MRYALGLVAAAVLVGRSSADDAADALRTVEQAIAAHGGSEQLAKLKHVSYSAKGSMFAGDMLKPMSREAQLALPDKCRWTFEITGTPLKMVFVVNGTKGWQMSQGASEPMGGPLLEELTEQSNALALGQLLPLRDNKVVTLATLPEAKVGGEPAVGVRASRKGFPDVDLYFDKKTGLLSKLGYKGKEAGRVVLKEVEYSKYKSVDGLMVPGKLAERMEGKPTFELTVEKYAFPEKFPDATFEKP